MVSHKEYNDQLFSRWAPVYDGFELILSGIRKKTVKQINPAGKSVLDVATGTGSLAIQLSGKAEKVVGIDLSAEMLAIARKKLHGDNLSFLEMDASAMTFDDDCFDIVTISLGLHDMPPEVRTAVLNEVKRVLKPEGILCVFEYDLATDELIGRIAYNLINLFESRYFQEFIESDLNEYLGSQGWRIERKSNYLFRQLQLLQLSSSSQVTDTQDL